jgi:hypothetical protein
MTGAMPSFSNVTRAAESVPSAFRVALIKTDAHLQPNLARRVVDEQAASADIAPQDRQAPVARLVLDIPLRHPGPARAALVMKPDRRLWLE